MTQTEIVQALKDLIAKFEEVEVIPTPCTVVLEMYQDSTYTLADGEKQGEGLFPVLKVKNNVKGANIELKDTNGTPIEITAMKFGLDTDSLEIATEAPETGMFLVMPIYIKENYKGLDSTGYFNGIEFTL
jgi:hypothetical protein